MGGALTRKGKEGEQYTISHFSERLSLVEESYFANERELLGMIYFLQRFRCYIEGSELEILTNSQVLRCFFSKTNLRKRKTRRLEFLIQFGITKVTLVKSKVRVLEDSLSRAPQIIETKYKANSTTLQTLSLSYPERMTTNYEADQTFGHILLALKTPFPRTPFQKSGHCG